MSFFSTKERAWGLDISDQTLRLAQFNGSLKKPKLQLYNEIKLPTGCVINGQIKKSEIFIENLKKLIKTKRGHGALCQEAVISLPDSESFLKSLFIETGNPQDLPAKIKELLPQEIPLEINEIYFDWQIIGKDNQTNQVLIGAVPMTIVNDYLKIISEAKITPVVLDLEATAISNLLIHQNQNHEPQIIIDIGQNRTGLFLYDGNNIQFSISLPFAGDRITEVIAQSLDLTLEQAESAKIVCGLDASKCQGAILEVLKPAISDLAQQIKRATDFYYNNFDNAKEINNLILCGGGANTLNIIKTLETVTKMKTIISQPFKNIKNPDPKFFTPDKSQSFITAMGLALRGLNPPSFYEHP